MRLHHRIAQVSSARPRHFGRAARVSRREFAFAHALEEVEILFSRPVAIRLSFARFGQGAAMLANLLAVEVIDVGLPS